jgi:hypothetical protein
MPTAGKIKERSGNYGYIATSDSDNIDLPCVITVRIPEVIWLGKE